MSARPAPVPTPAADGPTGRRGRPGYDQATVVRRATEVFLRQGYDATRMEDLAQALGVSKSAIYHHVPSKEHLLAQALDDGLDALTRLLDAADAREGDPVERLRWAVHHAVTVLAAHLPSVTLLLRVRGNGPVEAAAVARRRVLDARLTGLVAAAAAAGEVRRDLEPALVSRLVFGMVNSLVEWYDPQGPLGADALAAQVTELAFHGMVDPPVDTGEGTTARA